MNHRPKRLNRTHSIFMLLSIDVPLKTAQNKIIKRIKNKNRTNSACIFMLLVFLDKNVCLLNDHTVHNFFMVK